MFERSDLKTRAKLALKRNYWGCVIAPVLLAVLNDLENDLKTVAKEKDWDMMMKKEYTTWYISWMVTSIRVHTT